MMRYLQPEVLNQLAGAYALGTLSGRARRRFERLLRAHPSMARAVQHWEQRLLPLAASVPPVAPPKRVWQAITTQLNPTPRTSWFGSLSLWRMAAPLALGVLLGVGVVNFMPQQDGVPESYVGFLTGTPGVAPTMHASAMRKDAVLSIKMIKPVTLAPGQHLVLWGLAKDKPPKRIGIVPSPTGKSRMPLAASADITFKGITMLAVSVEANGAENSTAPSGGFVRQGPCVKLW